MDNGAEFYRRFLDGDDSGIVDIIRDYKNGLVMYLNGITGNLSFAEEIMEDTFFKLLTRKPKFSGRSTFKTWLYAIGRNTAYDKIRKNSRNPHTYMERQMKATWSAIFLKRSRKSLSIGLCGVCPPITDKFCTLPFLRSSVMAKQQR